MARIAVPASPERRTLIGKLAKASSRHSPENTDVVELKREVKAQTIADYIRALVDEAPALTTEQRDRLALLLRGSSTAQERSRA